MSGRRAQVGARAVEAALWVAVVLAGGFVLVPAAVELIQTREQEADEAVRADALEGELRTANHELDWVSDDPLAPEKLLER